MARADGVYSRVVAILKIILPLVALALLSTLFLLSRSTEPAMDLPFAGAPKVGEIAREQVGAPYFAGTTLRGDMLTMTAANARPEGADTIVADEVSAQMTLADGSQIDMDAGQATLRNSTQQAQLDGGVTITSTTGYVLTTDALVSAIDRIEVESLGEVKGNGPAGTLTAGKLQISSSGVEDAVQLVFTAGVKLIYDPRNK